MMSIEPRPTLGSLWVIVIIVLAARTTIAKKTDDDHPRVAGYLPDYRFYIDVDRAAPFLTDLFIFSVDPSQKGLRECCLQPNHYKAARKARQINGGLRLWVTLGGGGRSQGFAELFMSSDDSSAIVNDFQRATIKLAQEEELDGIIFDCEHFTSQEDYHGYLRLIRKVSIGLKEAKLGIAVAVHVGQFLSPDLYGLVDHIHLMAYDIGNAPYHGDMTRVKEAVKGLIDSGCPPHKILLGIPSYGRHSKNKGDVKTFAEIADGMLVDGAKELTFPANGEWKGYLFESPTGVQEKVAFAKKKGLAGVFFWELGQDKQHEIAKGGILLEAAASSSKIMSNDEL